MSVQAFHLVPSKHWGLITSTKSIGRVPSLLAIITAIEKDNGCVSKAISRVRRGVLAKLLWAGTTRENVEPLSEGLNRNFSKPLEHHLIDLIHLTAKEHLNIYALRRPLSTIYMRTAVQPGRRVMDEGGVAKSIISNLFPTTGHTPHFGVWSQCLIRFLDHN